MDLEEGTAAGADPLLIDGDAGPASLNISESTTAAIASAPNDITVEEGKALNKRQRFWTRVVVTTALLAMVFALASMVLEASAVAIIAFIVPLFTAPYVIYQRKIINTLPTLTHVINQTRHQVNRLSTQNRIFSNENDRLTTEVTDLKQVEYQFYKICKKYGTNVDEFKNLVDENGKIQKEMKKILDSQQLQDIFCAIMRSDTNGDFQITEQELDRLILRLKHYNVVDQERLKDTLRMWTNKTDTMEWKKMQEEANGGTMTGIPGWVL
mmetsp:Transcript_5188/g.6772  ORF Transcript_5188/g.6772 Transcript_5188/m.6772 type:complete len:268 (+) Transcript_5188:144-947(+)|eukprot:CAMPEP_0198155040 /NCGR_PEP_ID=MMETSP1443-20131203/68927_1 /TAXON_ID=186043 /ORGANISM="Entomoneis sp., Strain CCMP2396" /LENGTH=267 /DNA_ID=CAMNT_0043821771 /DNA_START=71 /DNA_END=874 /DNA_ORIENTATION=+